MMDLSFVVIGIISGLILTFFVGVICYKSYDNLMCNHWIPQTIISGLIIISITACMGKIDDTNMSIKNQLKTQLLLTMIMSLIIIIIKTIKLLFQATQSIHLIMIKALKR